MLTLIQRAERFKNRVAVVDPRGSFTYDQLLDASRAVALHLLKGKSSLDEARVAFLIDPGFEYVATQWGIWRAGGIAVPLATSHPEPELEHVLRDSDPVCIVVDSKMKPRITDLAHKLTLTVHQIDECLGEADGTCPDISPEQRAMIIYTSGTTGKPKGVVTTHLNLEFQVHCLIRAWGWSMDDRILNVLPLHHVHGVINVLTCALWSGACCEFLFPFDLTSVWKRFQRGDVSLFMAVPTIYAHLTKAWNAAQPTEQQHMTSACSRLRLMVSGSAALPIKAMESWQAISGHVLLERYGMTEIGMALSNPLSGKRRAGHVGKPLPGVQVRLASDEGVVQDAETQGEIQVKGPSVFLEYWRNPVATKEAFQDNWFCTGDTAIRTLEGDYRILGRTSVDIIKTGGYKVSALDIENVMLEHPEIVDCAVVGLEDEVWGERIALAMVTVNNRDLLENALKAWCRERLAPYKVPKIWKRLNALPRNTMGKVLKPDIRRLFSS